VGLFVAARACVGFNKQFVLFFSVPQETHKDSSNNTWVFSTLTKDTHHNLQQWTTTRVHHSTSTRD